MSNMPPKGTPIDWTNPISKGLVFASVGNQPDINLVDGARPSDGTTFAVRPGADGLGLDPDDLAFAPTDGSFWNKWHDSGRTFGFATYSLLLREVDTGSNDTILEIKINNNRHTLRFVNAAQNETISVSYYDTTETQINAGPVATPIGIDGKAHGAACSCESDGTLTLYGDGISLGTPGTTSNPGFLAQTLNNGFGVGNDWTGGTDWPGLIYLSLLWTRPLSAVEHAQLHANPWQVFQRRTLFAHAYPYDPTIVLEEEGPAAIEGSVSFNIESTATQINLLSAAVSQDFIINLIQDQSATVTGGGPTLTITLVDSAGTPLQNLSGLSWAWFDESTVNSATTPPDKGTSATTDSGGVFSVSLPNTTLTTGQTGMLALMNSTGQIYAIYRITLS